MIRNLFRRHPHRAACMCHKCLTQHHAWMNIPHALTDRQYAAAVEIAARIPANLSRLSSGQARDAGGRFR